MDTIDKLIIVGLMLAMWFSGAVMVYCHDSRLDRLEKSYMTGVRIGDEHPCESNGLMEKVRELSQWKGDIETAGNMLKKMIIIPQMYCDDAGGIRPYYGVTVGERVDALERRVAELERSGPCLKYQPGPGIYYQHNLPLLPVPGGGYEVPTKEVKP